MTNREGAPQRAAIYCRISDDREGRGLGVARQEAECRALADRVGWRVADGHVYTDNDLSAYRGRHRPGYRALLGAVGRGVRWTASSSGITTVCTASSGNWRTSSTWWTGPGPHRYRHGGSLRPGNCERADVRPYPWRCGPSGVRAQSRAPAGQARRACRSGSPERWHPALRAD